MIAGQQGFRLVMYRPAGLRRSRPAEAANDSVDSFDQWRFDRAVQRELRGDLDH